MSRCEQPEFGGVGPLQPQVVEQAVDCSHELACAWHSMTHDSNPMLSQVSNAVSRQSWFSQ